MSDRDFRAPSHAHPNRRPYNWLAYKTLDELLVRHSSCITGTVIDLGCGSQPYRSWLMTLARRYIGIDWANSIHEHAAEIVADLNHPIPVRDAAADTVFSISVLEHLYDPGMYLNEAFRILRPGGAMLLQVPFMWQVHEAPHDYHRFTRFGLARLLAGAGFKDFQIIPQTGFWGMWTLKLNYQLKRCVRGPRPVRQVLQGLLRIVWAIDQRVAERMDRVFDAPEETGAYFVVARKA